MAIRMDYEQAYDLVTKAFDDATNHYLSHWPEGLRGDARSRSEYITCFAGMLCETMGILAHGDDTEEWE